MHYDFTKYLVYTTDTGNPRVEGIVLDHRGQRRLSRKGIYWNSVLNNKMLPKVVGSTATHSLPRPETGFLTQPFESLTKTSLLNSTFSSVLSLSCLLLPPPLNLPWFRPLPSHLEHGHGFLFILSASSPLLPGTLLNVCLWSHSAPRCSLPARVGSLPVFWPRSPCWAPLSPNSPGAWHLLTYCLPPMPLLPLTPLSASQ